jgi:cation diffusion facilitator CzcD-associated flavoprotein CzcO
VSAAVPDHQVAIVGAGFSGIGAAISLQRAGIEDYAIIESGDAFGGTWQWNTYPGVAVDIPSFSYQFSFERRSDWSRVYAPGAELRAYAEHCADKYGLHDKVRFGTRIDAATFDDDGHAWRLVTADGEEVVARHVIDATGVLTHPKRPDIPGVDDFAGVTIHTARWDHAQDLAGKRVAVIGTGASAVQVIPAIADEVAHLTVFQRTPIWCLPKFDRPIPAGVRRVLRRVPGSQVVAGLAVAYGLANLVGTVAGWALLLRRVGSLDGWAIARSLTRMHLATVPGVVFALAVMAGAAHVVHDPSPAYGLVVTVVGGGGAIALYALCSRSLRVAEFGFLMKTMTARFGGRGGQH